MPFLRRVAIGCVLAWVFAGCSAPPPKQQPQPPAARPSPQREDAGNLRNQTNKPPVGFWALDARATAHEATVKHFRKNGGEIGFHMTAKGPEGYYGKAREVYDNILKGLSEPGVRHLVFRTNGIGDDWFTDLRAWRAEDFRFQWTMEAGSLNLRYSQFIVKAEFNTNQIRYPAPGGGVLIFRPAALKPDTSDLNRAHTNVFASLDAIMKALPSVNSATGAVQIIDAWSLANETLCAASERFAANYPEVHRRREMPPEFSVTFEEVESFKARYSALTTDLGRLRQFMTVPEVQEALKRLEKSAVRIQQLGKPLQK